ncbi:MAG: response regulator [Desulfatirhabdiaceae bacterium]
MDSRPGKETRFNIYLPLLEKDRDDAEEVKVGGAYQKGFERILLIDDEEPILSMEQKFLSRLGYHVTVRTDSQSALADFRASPDQYDLIITDMAKPKLTGDELSRRMLDIRPDIPIILCTGFSESIDEEKAKAIGIRGFALKPLSTWELSNLNHNVLKGSRG